MLVVGQNGPDLPPALGTWTGGEFSLSAAPILPAVGAAGFTTTVDQLAVLGSTMLGIRVASSWSGLRDIYDDFAPEPGTPSYAFAVTFAAVPVAPPQAPAPPAPPAPATTAHGRQACTVPNVRRLVATSARRKLSRVGCRSRVVRVGSRVKTRRVVSTSPTAGTRTRRTVVVRVSMGST